MSLGETIEQIRYLEYIINKLLVHASECIIKGKELNLGIRLDPLYVKNIDESTCQYLLDKAISRPEFNAIERAIVKEYSLDIGFLNILVEKKNLSMYKNITFHPKIETECSKLNSEYVTDSFRELWEKPKLKREFDYD